jgi:DNA repair photolyase
MPAPPLPRGRGTAENPPNRFDRLHVEPDPESLDADDLPRADGARRQAERVLFADTTRTPFSRNDSPDIPFRWGLNPYRGCEHGCPYCFARPTHEYLGFSPGLDFETKLVVKPELPRLIGEAFQKPSWRPEVVIVSGNTDPYQPVERKLGLTRRCLAVFAHHRNPVGIITKNALVTRDLDLLRELAARDLIHVLVSVTTLRDAVAGPMEPRASRPAERLEAVARLAEAGVPVGVNVAPVIPGLTDEELPAIVAAAAAHGAGAAFYQVVRLPGPVAPLFEAWLRRHFPDRVEKVLGRLRTLRDGKLNDPRFGHRFRTEGPWADVLRGLFRSACAQHGLDRGLPPFAVHHFRRLHGGQLDLF